MKDTLMKRISPHLLLALGLALLAGCSASSETGSAQLAVSVPQSLSASISRVSVTASAPDFSSVSVELVSSNGVWGGTLGNLPVGPSRFFLAQAFDASGTRLFEGSASGVSISADQTSLIAITLQQVHAPPPFQNEAPVIDSLVASSTSTFVSAGNTLSLVATAHDPNAGDALSFAWSSTAGAFSSASSASTSWTAPDSTGIHTLTLSVTDSGGLASSMSLAVYVLPNQGLGHARFTLSFNTSPQVDSLNASLTRLAVGQTTSVTASASDPDGDSLSYSWGASCAGAWTRTSSNSARFTPSALPAGACNNCRLTVFVSDGRGGQTTGTVNLCVSNTLSANHLPPVLLSVYSSSAMTSPGQVLTYEVVASDPEGSALSFSWTAQDGSLGTPTHGTSSSRITWTAPSCVEADAPPNLTVTVTNAFNLTATQRFAVTGLPVCPLGSWTSTGSMLSPRHGHTATLLKNGKVLVSGGGYDATAEVYDPASGTWSATGPMRSVRSNHTATLLENGKVLVSGGFNNGSTLETAEVYDPASGTWSATGSMAWSRYNHTATLLNNGTVLVSGSYRWNDGLVTAEVYNPDSGTWSAATSMAWKRSSHTATPLDNGTVLVSGGISGSSLPMVEVYDPASGVWSATGSMTSARFLHTATPLNNGKVLVSGGIGGGYLATAEVYDPASGTWSATGSMATPRHDHTETLLLSGKVLVAGGSAGNNIYHATAEVYRPGSGTWRATAPMSSVRTSHTATPLPNGQVLVVGGFNGSSYLKTAELYTP
jgi:hypothetical protein